MKTRMTLATGLCATVLALAGCGTTSGGDDADPTPTPSATSAPATEAPDDDSTPQSATDLVGEWDDPEAEWTVRFEEDGSFTEDFQGIADFRTGTYELEDGIVTLNGGDGDSTRGSVEGDALAFRLGTLTRS